MALATALATGPLRIAAEVGATLGEGPVWDAARQCLWFVDIKQQRLFRYDPADARCRQWRAPGDIGWALPTDAGDLLCGLADGLYRFDVDTAQFAFWRAVEPQSPGNRLNDACTDAAGRLWFGSMDNAETVAAGSFYRLADGALAVVGPGPMTITNGPALAPDGRTIYFTDTLARRIWRAPVDDHGAVGAANLFVEFTGEAGYPDGPVTDAAGNLWTGMFGGAGAWCFDPSGVKRGFVAFPTANVTKLAFGGADLKTVYATTATKGLSAGQRAAEPAAGNLFAFDVAVAGCAVQPLRI